jgi:hypothetical protein
MNQEQLLARRDELARENQLGELAMYRTPMTFRGRVILGAVFGGLALLFLSGVVAYGQAANPIGFQGFPTPVAVIFYAILVSLIPVGYSLTDRNYVYVYTNGLVCFNSSGGEQIIHWGEIDKVGRAWWGSRNPAIYVKLNDDTRMKLPTLGSHGSASNGALQQFIEGKMVQAYAEPILPRQPLTFQPLPEPSLTSTSVIPLLKPSYHGSETSITGSVTLSIVHQSQDGVLRAKWIRDDFGGEYSCEGTITHEGTITLISTDSHGDSALRIHGSILPNGHLEGSLYTISEDGSSQRHSWSLA